MVSEFITLKTKTNERVKVQMAVGCLSRQRSVGCFQVQKEAQAFAIRIGGKVEGKKKLITDKY